MSPPGLPSSSRPLSLKISPEPRILRTEEELLLVKPTCCSLSKAKAQMLEALRMPGCRRKHSGTTSPMYWWGKQMNMETRSWKCTLSFTRVNYIPCMITAIKKKKNNLMHRKNLKAVEWWKRVLFLLFSLICWTVQYVSFKQNGLTAFIVAWQ